jgi:REP element-mobilizing transposase RayT
MKWRFDKEFNGYEGWAFGARRYDDQMEKPTLFQNRYRIPHARLRGWDYADPGWYFVTIVTGNRVPWFGEIRNGVMGLNDIGCVIHECWNEIPTHYPHVTTDEFIVMPDHVHGILCIGDRPHVETCESHVSTVKNRIPRPKPGSLGSIISQFKSVTTKRIRINHPNFSWQTRYHDHIIRSGKLDNVRAYIRQNPAMWGHDEFVI